MGAIAGVVGAEDPVRRVKTMIDAAPHRGRRVDVATLGSSALALVDDEEFPDAAVGIDGDLSVAFAGTIDNRREFAAALRERDGSVRLDDDMPGALVRLIGAGFRAYGHDLPARLRGMFSAIVSDGTTAYCFRDHLGYKPLFYRRDDLGFYAASEAKQVVAGAAIPREPDLDVLGLIFYRSLTDETPAALKGVERLPKMTGLIVDGHGVRRRRYWQPELLLETGTFSAEEIQERFDALMETAVSRCLTGHDLLSLSGGIDSPAVAAYAVRRHRELSGKPLSALSVVFPKYPSVDESRYVQMLAEHYDIPLHTYEQSANRMADLRRWTALVDTPYVSASLAQYEEDYLKARSLGFRNLLTGEHAEFLGAIKWFTLDHYLSHGRFRPAWGELAARRASGRSWLSIARLAGRAIAPDRLIKAADRVRGHRSPMVPAWVDLRMATDEDPVPVRERFRRSQLGAFIGPGTSLEADEICQAVCGIRVRRPWTDVDLWEFFLSLPAEQKFPDLRSKGLIRNLLRGRVPDEILDRTDKTVFDEAAKAEMDYGTLEGLLVNVDPQVKGVDYAALGRLIMERRLTMLDYVWARNLANIHAFMAQW